MRGICHAGMGSACHTPNFTLTTRPRSSMLPRQSLTHPCTRSMPPTEVHDGLDGDDDDDEYTGLSRQEYTPPTRSSPSRHDIHGTRTARTPSSRPGSAKRMSATSRSNSALLPRSPASNTSTDKEGAAPGGPMNGGIFAQTVLTASSLSAPKEASLYCRIWFIVFATLTFSTPQCMHCDHDHDDGTPGP